MKKYYSIYPFLFALIPVLSLYNYNKELVNLKEIIIPAIISLALTAVVFFILLRQTKNQSKAVFLTAVFSILFFSFSLFNEFSSSIFKLNYLGSLDYYLTLALFLLLISAIYSLVCSYKKNFDTWHKYLFCLSFILIIFSIINTAYYFFSFRDVKLENEDVAIYLKDHKKEQNQNYPDIYYLIFDGHARSDVLRDLYNYDNQEFISFLQDTGFYVAENSLANYPQTYLSISSTLNLSYLDKISQQLGIDSDDRRVLTKLIKDNEVDRVLDRFGYTFVSTPSSWNLKPQAKTDLKIDINKGVSNFKSQLIDQTPLRILFEIKSFSKKDEQKVLKIFDLIPKIANIEGPTFNYSHILSPHPPFLFDKNGEILENTNPQGVDGSHYFLATRASKEYYREKYVNQLHYIDQRIKTLIENILSKYSSDNQPIIIIQSDHGPGMQTDWESLENTNVKERMSILNAYYVPESLKNKLYTSITPVNTFRLLFNDLFQMNLKLLDDKSYFTTWEKPFDFIEVSDSLK